MTVPSSLSFLQRGVWMERGQAPAHRSDAGAKTTSGCRAALCVEVRLAA